jgi:single-strand DNA-binding protein
MYQQITLVGNLGRDPEMRYTASGAAVTSFPVATSQRWTGADGQRNEKTIWFRVSAWERQAETCNQFLTKGQRVLVVGEVEEPYVYTDQEGNSRASLQVKARNVQFLNTRAEAGAMDGGGGQHGDQSGPAGGGSGTTQEPGGEEDIPF